MTKSTGEPGVALNIFESDENFGMAAYTFAENVKAKIQELGIGNYQRPRLAKDHESIFVGVRSGQYFDGRLPTVIRKLTLDQLSALFSLYSNWYGYLTTQTMLVAAERSEAIRKKEYMLHHLKNLYRTPGADGTKIPETAVSDAAKTDARYVTVSAEYEEVNALYAILDAMRKVADQDMKVVSREVTIQQEKLRKDILERGFGNRGRDPDFDDAVEDMEGYRDGPPQNSSPARRPAHRRALPRR